MALIARISTKVGTMEYSFSEPTSNCDSRSPALVVKGEKMNNFSRMSANKLFEYGDSDAVTERARKVGELLKRFRSESE